MEEPVRKKRIFSGIQPSGKLTVGNYLGAVKNWISLQDTYDCVYAVVDLHAVTVRQEPAALRRQTLEVLAQLIACGVDPEKCILFIQSHVHEHAELAWVLGCHTMFGELSRMTQFKDKSRRNADNINAGLFTYPTLMAADILLYQADCVPVGQDQTQHVELARDIAMRMNGLYNNLFTLPEALIPKTGARVMSLQDPLRKMSKSDENANAYILLTDKPEEIERKIKRSVTDSDARVAKGPGKEGVENLMAIYAASTGQTVEEIEAAFFGRGYGEFKRAVAESVVEMLRPAREKTEELLRDKVYLEEIYKKGAERASAVAVGTVKKVYKKLGFAER